MTKIWLVSRKDRVGYDEFDAMVVFAETEEDALSMHPYGVDYGNSWSSWAERKDLTIQYLGKTDRKVGQEVILASFNAG